ncbi:hypothetical protein [Candidatus Absconditicoccus praedator]|uniref:hypothetical protein n=1 Tax=Candidatus Absconditicoccus praedator TaxID=2735562 RepID=UPI001E360862|nr:hypothetical protein [Candidatus Absconditicoccus praedator]UFX83403.1 hypothetical protein HLG78_04720 [Candidatus Absconditicoccus praedator]
MANLENVFERVEQDEKTEQSESLEQDTQKNLDTLYSVDTPEAANEIDELIREVDSQISYPHYFCNTINEQLNRNGIEGVSFTVYETDEGERKLGLVLDNPDGEGTSFDEINTFLQEHFDAGKEGGEFFKEEGGFNEDGINYENFEENVGVRSIEGNEEGENYSFEVGEDGREYVEIKETKGTRAEDVIKASFEQYFPDLDSSLSDKFMQKFKLNIDNDDDREGNFQQLNEFSPGKITFDKVDEGSEGTNIDAEDDDRFLVVEGDRMDLSSFFEAVDEFAKIEQRENIESEKDFGYFYQSGGVEHWDLPDVASIDYKSITGKHDGEFSGENIGVKAESSATSDRESVFSDKQLVHYKENGETKTGFVVFGSSKEGHSTTIPQEYDSKEQLEGVISQQATGTDQEPGMSAFLATPQEIGEDGNISKMELKEVGDPSIHEFVDVGLVDKGSSIDEPIFPQENQDGNFEYSFGNSNESTSVQFQKESLANFVEGESKDLNSDLVDIDGDIGNILPKGKEEDGLYLRFNEIFAEDQENSDGIFHVFKDGDDLKIELVQKDSSDTKEIDIEGEREGFEINKDMLDMKVFGGSVESISSLEKDDDKYNQTIEYRSDNIRGTLPINFEFKPGSNGELECNSINVESPDGDKTIKFEGFDSSFDKNNPEGFYSSFLNQYRECMKYIGLGVAFDNGENNDFMKKDTERQEISIDVSKFSEYKSHINEAIISECRECVGEDKDFSSNNEYVNHKLEDAGVKSNPWDSLFETKYEKSIESQYEKMDNIRNYLEGNLNNYSRLEANGGDNFSIYTGGGEKKDIVFDWDSKKINIDGDDYSPEIAQENIDRMIEKSQEIQSTIYDIIHML